jgi:hypothetical protein
MADAGAAGTKFGAALYVFRANVADDSSMTGVGG